MGLCCQLRQPFGFPLFWDYFYRFILSKNTLFLVSLYSEFFFAFPFLCSCVNRKSSDLGLKGVQREYLQTDCAINKVRLPVHSL